MDGWRDGGMEGWRDGGMMARRTVWGWKEGWRGEEVWKDGWREGGRLRSGRGCEGKVGGRMLEWDGAMEGWRDGGMEGWMMVRRMAGDRKQGWRGEEAWRDGWKDG